MAIQFTGEYNLQTPNNNLPNNLPEFSISCTVQFSTECTATAAVVQIFTKTYCAFGISVGNPGQLQLFLADTGGQPRESFTYQPNQAYFIVLTNESGFQGMYLNGVLVASYKVTGLPVT